jgi:hypothetical protein
MPERRAPELADWATPAASSPPPPPPPADTTGVAAWAGVATAQATMDPPIGGDDPWRRSTSTGVAEAYRVLGIDWEATWAEVTAEFRMQAACWHPDRLATAAPEVQQEGQRRMSELNRAYNDLRRALRPANHRELFAD